MCGKNFDSQQGTKLEQGSPPRVREKPKEYLDGKKITGITPACAGKTDLNSLSTIHWWDHPRVCGKNTFPNGTGKYSPGSPPRVREKRR